MKRRLILLGPPASGKGTIAGRLQKEFGLPHVSSGYLLRREAERGSAIGSRAKVFLEKGELVPDSVVLEFMSSWLRMAVLDAGFMLDGFPRTLVQAKALDDWLAARAAPIEAAVLFECDLAVVLERIAGRRSCPQCGRVYQLKSLPPRQAGLCDECGVALIQRDDDTAPVMRRRYAVYDELTMPLAEFYERQGKLTRIAAAAAVEERFSKVAAALS